MKNGGGHFTPELGVQYQCNMFETLKIISKSYFIKLSRNLKSYL